MKPLRQCKNKSGSPPHTWRKLNSKKDDRDYIGITSTYVEKTELLEHNPRLEQDHLHIRGENFGRVF